MAKSGADQPFLTDVKTLRDRARKHIESGPVNDTYRGDVKQAIEILQSALEDLDVQGVQTNRALLIGVLGHPDFRGGFVSTDWLEHAIR